MPLPSVGLEPVLLLSFVLMATLTFVECQPLSMVVESFNLRSAQSTNLKCSLIKEIKLNKSLLEDWHCIGGTLVRFPLEPGMWIMTASPLIKVEERKMPFEITYHEMSISATFDLGNEVNRQLTSTATMHMGHENSPSDLNATMTYIQFPPDNTSPCPGGISTGFVVALIEGIILVIIGANAAFQFYSRKRVQIYSASGREGEENLGIDNEE